MSSSMQLTSAFKNELRGTDAYIRHKRLIKNYLKYYGGKVPGSHIPDNYKTERDIIKENHKFVRSEEDKESTWEQRVAKKYYDKLFKEYAICELKYYKEGKIALRWRVEKEVMSGKGQFICASTGCDSTTKLESWEVNFAYMEDGEKKNELVKVRLCPECSDKLNYKTKKRAAKTLKRKKDDSSKETLRQSKRNKRSSKDKHDTEHSSSSEDEEESDDGCKQEKETAKTDPSIWSKPVESKEERSKEEEYEDYFADLLQ